MELSELYGRIGQILREYGDMEVVRFRSLNIDGIIGTNLNSFVDYTAKDFNICKDYVQKQIDVNQFEEKLVQKHFIINIPFN